MERLVEEIAEIWEPWGGPGGYYPDWVKVQRAKATIARIGKAYADGELELSGEVGRFVALYDGSNDIGLGRWLGSFPYDIKLIALPAVRKEKEQ